MTAPASPAEDLVLITVAEPLKSVPDFIEQIAALRSTLTHLSIPNAIPDQPLAVEVPVAEDAVESNARPAMDAGDPAQRALMFGRYIGQIRARIERAWIKPRSDVDGSGNNVEPKTSAADTEFTCRAQIRQDARGYVQEVLLLQCDGSETWRRSLVVAINQSSPLPAPPTPTVFTRELDMTFQAQAYRQGMPVDGYAVEGRVEFAGGADPGSYASQSK